MSGTSKVAKTLLRMLRTFGAVTSQAFVGFVIKTSYGCKHTRAQQKAPLGGTNKERCVATGPFRRDGYYSGF
jgi:hypothetical protein